MEKLKGKVKAISVKEVTEGMQLLLFFSKEWLVGIIDKELNWVSKHKSGGSLTIPTKGRDTKGELKTLVVEYEEEIIETDGVTYLGKLKTKQIPLKYSQWQAAIDNGEVDSDKEVEFETIYSIKQRDSNGLIVSNYRPITYAKIIPQKKRVYTEEEVKELCKKAFNAGRISKSEALKGNCNFQEDIDWIKENL